MKTADYAKTLLLVAVVLYFALPRGSGFLLATLLPFFVLMMLYNLVRMARRPDERNRRGMRLAIWFVAVILVGAVQSYWAFASRKDADMAAMAVLAHAARTGAYPASLDELGLDEQTLADKWTLRYSVRDGKAALVYPASLIPLTTYEYDFEARAWRENAY